MWVVYVCNWQFYWSLFLTWKLSIKKLGKVSEAVGAAAGEVVGVVAGEIVCKLTGDMGGECEAAGRVEGKKVDFCWLEKNG